jgi:hypothetical protein
VHASVLWEQPYWRRHFRGIFCHKKENERININSINVTQRRKSKNEDKAEDDESKNEIKSKEEDNASKSENEIKKDLARSLSFDRVCSPMLPSWSYL